MSWGSDRHTVDDDIRAGGLLTMTVDRRGVAAGRLGIDELHARAGTARPPLRCDKPRCGRSRCGRDPTPTCTARTLWDTGRSNWPSESAFPAVCRSTPLPTSAVARCGWSTSGRDPGPVWMSPPAGPIRSVKRVRVASSTRCPQHRGGGSPPDGPTWRTGSSSLSVVSPAHVSNGQLT